MKVNLILDENNVITSVITYPIDESLITIDIDDYTTIHCGYDRYVSKTILKSKKYESDLKKENTYNRILELKKLLSDTDYIAIKYAEGLLSEEEYKSIKELRKSYRDEINTLEKEL